MIIICGNFYPWGYTKGYTKNQNLAMQKDLHQRLGIKRYFKSCKNRGRNSDVGPSPSAQICVSVLLCWMLNYTPCLTAPARVHQGGPGMAPVKFLLICSTPVHFACILHFTLHNRWSPYCNIVTNPAMLFIGHIRLYLCDRRSYF